MKAFTKFFATSVLLTIFYTVNPIQVKAQGASVNFQVFYDDLSPYGQWIDYRGYGYAWVPSAGPDFIPYSTGGHWVWTDYGWTWVSDYDWGWAPFHYGRWDYDNYYGWVWIPDNEWGPHGFPGEEVADITDGHRFHRVFHLIWQSVIIIHLPIDGSFCRIVTWGEMIFIIIIGHGTTIRPISIIQQ